LPKDSPYIKKLLVANNMGDSNHAQERHARHRACLGSKCGMACPPR